VSGAFALLAMLGLPCYTEKEAYINVVSTNVL
jgi:hypothetical protein